MQTWDEANEWEREWHGNCVNSYQEETKQIQYAIRMGLRPISYNGRYPVFDLQKKSVLDIGGGPYSLLLKCHNFSKATVIDPLKVPDWCRERYKAANIMLFTNKAEDVNPEKQMYDEVWCYNVLQHTEDPEKIINNMRKAGKIIRIHEWLNTPITDGHIHSFSRQWLDKKLGGTGFSFWEDWGAHRQEAYAGIFSGI